MSRLEDLRHKKVTVIGIDNICIANATLSGYCDLFIVLDLGKIEKIIPWTAIREISFDKLTNITKESEA